MKAESSLGLALGAGQLLVARGPAGDFADWEHAAMPFEGGTPDDVVNGAIALAEELGHDPEGDGVVSVGAALHGHVDHANGTVVFGQNLKSHGDSWHDVEFVEMLEDAFGAPAAIDNDVNSMVLYQQELGLGRGEPSFVVVYLVPGLEGIGSGILVDGKLVRGWAGGAGEFGHLVVQPGGPRCPCGNRGCLQAVVGGETLIRNVNWGQRHEVSDLARAAKLVEEGDPRAVDAFLQAGRSLGQGLSIFVNLLNPPLIIIGGPEEVVVDAPAAEPGSGESSADLFRRGFEETLQEYSFANLQSNCRIKIGTLTGEMAAVGAGILGVRSRPGAVPARDEPGARGRARVG